MKHKVIVVDDKPLIRRSIIETIDWEKLGCLVVGEAENGLEAKTLVEKEKPELIITDIEMPGLSGLDLAQYITTLLPASKIIMITGYQEFEYAQRALSLGVCDLVLKPIDNHNLESKIRKALAKLETWQYTEREMQHSRKARQAKYLSELIQGRRRADEWTDEDASIKYYTFIYMRVRCADPGKTRLIKSRTYAEMEAYQNTCGFEVLELGSESDLLIAVLEKQKSARQRSIQLKTCLQEINRKIMQEYGVTGFFAVSPTLRNVSDIPKCCREAKEIFENRYFLNEENILFTGSASFPIASNNTYIIQELDKFYRDLEHMDHGVMKTEAAQIIDNISAETGGNEFRVKCLLSEICITLLRHYRRDVPREQIDVDTNHILARINRLTDIQSSKEWLFEFINKMKDYAGQNEHGVNPLVLEAMDCIHRHYRENLSLTQVAQTLNTNASYLSRLLKKESGRNFVDILTDYRIREAKRLLDRPGSRIIEVCNQVGYCDYTYFYQVFKKVEGISPSEYKKKGKKT